MENIEANTFLPFIRDASISTIREEIANPSSLVLDQETHRNKLFEIAYAPFDYVNQSAKIVIVGITPGRQQMENALLEYAAQLASGATVSNALASTKTHASFSGPMRKNLVAMLNSIGVPKLLGLESTDELWGEASNLAHFTSALRYPVFMNGSNYSGTPEMLKVPVLKEYLEKWLLQEMQLLPNALYVPLGPKVGDVVSHVAEMSNIPKVQILSGLPHPSGANAERIAYFLGRKKKEDLSVKANSSKIDAARSSLSKKINLLGAI